MILFRSYEAEVAYIEVKSEEKNSTLERGRLSGRVRPLRSSNKSERLICRVNCTVCNKKADEASMGSPRSVPYPPAEETRWLRSKGRYISIGAAIISCRNEKAPDGLVADAHLSDGFLHLILIKDCPHALYLWYVDRWRLSLHTTHTPPPRGSPSSKKKREKFWLILNSVSLKLELVESLNC